MDDILRDVRNVLAQQGRLSVDAMTLDTGVDLYTVGLTSHASVNVMLALEEVFGVEFPDELLRRSTFESIASIGATLARIGAA
ncbi:acyl carrier protein [Rhodococcus sp. O3]|uniref:acyl carrier protein n=1 Tax=Rhodococcus sp. O3 TaxID=3404919 RepID=UPI003B6740B1